MSLPYDMNAPPRKLSVAYRLLTTVTRHSASHTKNLRAQYLCMLTWDFIYCSSTWNF